MTITSTHLDAVAAAISIPSTTATATATATGAVTAPTGTNALFGVVQTTLTIGSVIPLLLAVVAVLLWFTTRYRGPGQTRSSTGSAASSTPVEHAQRLHDLGRVALLGSAFGVVLLGIGEVVVAYGTPAGLAGAFSDGVSPLLVPAVVLTVVSAALFATSRRPGR